MRKPVLNMVLAACIAALCVVVFWAVQSSMQPPATAVSTAAAPAQVVQQQIVDLPQDAGNWYVSVCLHDDWRSRPLDRAVASWWNIHPRLVSIKTQTHYKIYVESDPIYKTTLAKLIGPLPCILVQDSSGTVIYKSSGENVGSDGDEIANDIGRIFPIFPLRPRPCPGPNPCPKPDVKPDVKPNVDVDLKVIPDVKPAKPAGADFPWVLLVVVVVLASGATLVKYFKDEIRAVS